MEWLDIWKEEPPRDDLILVLANDIPYIGTVIGTEKLRKIYFLIDESGEKLEFCARAPVEERITHWCKLPQLPNIPKVEDK